MQEPPYRIKNMMPGMIMGWYGSVATIPSGWHLCDGTTGTIDLRNKFIVGAGDVHLPGGEGGSNLQSHTFTGDGHAHDLPSDDVILDSTPAGAFAHTTGIAPASGTTDETDNRPVFYAMVWIQKL